jgi:Tol biopolymer transport system component
MNPLIRYSLHRSLVALLILVVLAVRCRGSTPSEVSSIPTAEVTLISDPTDDAQPTAVATQPLQPPPSQTIGPCSGENLVFNLSTGFDPDPRDGFYEICSDGSGLHQIAAAASASLAVSPDGKHIAYYEHNGHKIIIVTSAGERVKSLDLDVSFENDTLAGQLSWSPDGRFILYRQANLANFKLGVVDVSTGKISSNILPETYYKQFQEANMMAAWNPQNASIAWSVASLLYMADIDCDTPSHECNAQNITQLQITPKGIDGGSRLAWSPDGTRLATACYVRDSMEVQNDLCIFDISGHLVKEFNAARLGVDFIKNPDWSRDGSWIAFSANASETEDIFVLSLKDDSLVDLTKGDRTAESSPNWLP